MVFDSATRINGDLIKSACYCLHEELDYDLLHVNDLSKKKKQLHPHPASFGKIQAVTQHPEVKVGMILYPK